MPTAQRVPSSVELPEAERPDQPGQRAVGVEHDQPAVGPGDVAGEDRQEGDDQQGQPQPAPPRSRHRQRERHGEHEGDQRS